MQNSNTLNNQQLYEKKKIRVAVIGLIMGVGAAVASVVLAISSGIADPLISSSISFESTFIRVVITAVIMAALCDIVAGIFAMLFCGITKRNPAKEVKRTMSLPVSWLMFLSAFIAGPLGTGATLAAYFMCGTTMAACVLAFTPLILSVFSRIVFKENLSARAYLGMCILVIGTIVVGFAPIERSPLFIFGILCALFAAICYSLEGISSTYAADMIDEYIGCGIFRCFGSGLCGLILVVIIAAVSGNFDFFTDYFSTIWKAAFWMPIIGGFANCCQYNLIYGAFVKCGPARCQAMVYTLPIWTIIMGVAAHGIFGDMYPYECTLQAVIGAVVVVFAVILIICKPSELIKLRDN